MDKRKKALILAALAVTLPLSGCSKKNNNDKENETSIIQEYNNTVEKEFEIGEHFVTVVYRNNDSILLANLQNYAIESFENLYVPDGYTIQDFEYITSKGTTTGLSVAFVNNKKVIATGILKDDGNYHYDEFGEIVKEKTLTKNKKN